MKTIFIVLAVLSLSTEGLSQEKKVIASYWVVETNINQKNYTIVRLYDKANTLVHEVKMDDIYFDVTQPRHRKMLNQLLKGYYSRADVTANRIRRENTRASMNRNGA